MKFRNINRKYYQQSPDTTLPLAAGTGNAPAAAPNGAPGNVDGQQQQQQNNNGNNEPDYAKLWSNPDNKQAQSDENNQQQGQQQTTGQQQTAAEQMDAHVATLNLTDGIDAAQIGADLQAGNFESLNTALGAVASNAYKAAITSANQLMESKIESAVEQATTRAGGEFQTELAVRQMHEALPFTKNLAFEPIAKATFAQAMKQKDVNGNVEKAIETVKGYFQALAKEAGFPGNKAPNPQPGGGGGFNQGETEETDWIKFLSE